MVAALLALAAATPFPAFGETPSPQQPPLPVTVQLTDLEPIAPQPGDVLHLTGILHNISTTPISDLAVDLLYNPNHIGSRSQFDDYAEPRSEDCTPACPLPLPPDKASSAIPALAAPSLAPGAGESFSISVPVNTLSLDRPWEVFELGVQVSGSTPNGFGAVGGLRTFLPWAPRNQPSGSVGSPTQVAWVWPLVDSPHRTVGPTFTDDTLARSLGSGGRLDNLLQAGAAAQAQTTPPAPPAPKKKGKHPKPVPPPPPVLSVPVTWAVDPMLVEDAAMMASGYKAAGSHGPVAGTGTAAAKKWLNDLRAAAVKSDVLALPYADPDLVAADREAADDKALATEIQVAINSGQKLIASDLGTTPLTDSWPPDGFLDQGTLNTLFAAGVTTVVLDDRALEPLVAPNLTPSANTTINARDGTFDALLTDHILDAVVDAGAADPALQRLAVQRFLAETLMIQAEQPFLQRTIVVAPDRRWAPSATYAAALAGDTGKVPWITPVGLSAASTTPEVPKLVRSALHYPSQARRAELSGDYLSGVADVKQDADEFAAILTPGDPSARAFDDGILRTLSSAWRSDPGTAYEFRQHVNDALAATMKKVHIASAPDSFVTLTSHSGTVPVTVANDLDTPVHIGVEISSQHLQVSGGGRVTEIIPAHRQIAVDVRATARTSGVFPLQVELLTPDFDKVYDSTHLFVRSTAYGAVAILITALATGVLLLAVVIRLVRRALAGRRSTTAAA
ncbi:MAG TPA: DUF6049 family protein [Mycobacteriales bacterium]|nr:DUF6049 family protein [Mycobacteriales bacterium]